MSRFAGSGADATAVPEGQCDAIRGFLRVGHQMGRNLGLGEELPMRFTITFGVSRVILTTTRRQEVSTSGHGIAEQEKTDYSTFLQIRHSGSRGPSVIPLSSYQELIQVHQRFCQGLCHSEHRPVSVTPFAVCHLTPFRSLALIRAEFSASGGAFATFPSPFARASPLPHTWTAYASKVS